MIVQFKWRLQAGGTTSAAIVGPPGKSPWDVLGITFEEYDASLRAPAIEAAAKIGPVLSYTSGDNTNAVLAFFALVAITGYGRIKTGRYICNQPVAIDASFNVDMEEGAVLDFSGAVGILSNGAALDIGNETITELPSPSVNVAKGDLSVTAASTPALSIGEWYILLWDEEYSWLPESVASNRPYYKAGEWFRVKSVAGAVITNDATALHSYSTASPLKLGKPTQRKVRISGGTVIGNTASNSSVIRCRNLNRSWIDVEVAQAKRAGIDMHRCVDTSVREQMSDYNANVNLNYGVSMIACLNCRVIDSNIRTTRHAVTFTGGGVPYSIPNRNCYAVNSALNGGLYGLDSHGAAEFVGARGCEIKGGVNLGGDHTSLHTCEVWANTDTVTLPGIAIRHRERRGCNTVIKDTIVHTLTAPGSSDAVINLDMPAAAIQGGIIDIDVTVHSPVEVVNAVRIAGGAAAGEVMDIRARVNWIAETAGLRPPHIRIDASGTTGYRDVSVNVAQVAPRLISWTAARTEISGHVERSVDDGLSVDFTAPGYHQDLDILEFRTGYNDLGGVVIGAPSAATDISVEVRGGRSIANNQSGVAGTNAKSSYYFNNVKRALVVGATVGDPQLPTQTQNRTFSAINCGYFEERLCPVLDATPATLGSNFSGTTTKAVGERTPGLSIITTTGGVTISVVTHRQLIRDTATLSANQVASLSTSNCVAGDWFLYTRTGAGAFNRSVGGLKDLATNTWCKVVFDGAAWTLAAYGVL